MRRASSVALTLSPGILPNDIEFVRSLRLTVAPIPLHGTSPAQRLAWRFLVLHENRINDSVAQERAGFIAACTVEVNRRGSGRSVLLQNAHPEDVVGRRGVATIGHCVPFRRDVPAHQSMMLLFVGENRIAVCLVDQSVKSFEQGERLSFMDRDLRDT